MGLRVEGMKHGLADLGEALSDPTRRSILRYVLDAEEPVTALDVADAFGVHRTVARGHLERLVQTGFLKSGRRPSTTGFGRPRKTYAESGERIVVMVPPRRYESLARLLLHIVEGVLTTPEAVERAREAGHQYGEGVRRELQGTDEGRMAPAAACAWLRQEGYAAHCECDPDGEAYVFENCVYEEVAAEHAEIACAFCGGMLSGLVGVRAEELRRTHELVEHGYCRHVIGWF